MGDKAMDTQYGYDSFDQWLEETLEKDMKWIEQIKQEFDRRANDYPHTDSNRFGSKERSEAYHKAKMYVFGISKWVGQLIVMWNPREVEKVLRQDMEARKVKLLKQITEKVGDIVKLEIHRNPNGGVDGIIFGTNGTARIETIVAGGYNIQRLHYRTLVKVL